MTRSLPFFSIVVPVLNEEPHIGQVLSSLLEQVRDHDCEILVMDGGSVDRTRAIAAEIAIRNPSVKLIDNPARTQSAACNLAAELVSARSRLLVRADAHAFYPSDFVLKAIAALRESGATSVVVPMRTVGRGVVQRAIAATQNSRLGNGGASHRRLGASRFVDHGHHAVFDLDFFRAIGGYDVSFTHNEDAELDVRALRAGGRIWLCGEAAIDYFPRNTWRGLARQYRAHGRGRARTTRKHGLRLKTRQCLPLALLAGTALGLLAPLSPCLGIPAVSYLGLAALWGAAEAARRRDPALLLMGPSAVVMHLSWAAGYLESRLRDLPRPRALSVSAPAQSPGLS